MSDGEEPEAGDTEAAAPAEPARMYDVLVTEAFGQTVLHPSVDQYIDTIAALKADGYVSVIDLCGADYLTNPNRSLPADIAGERFEIVVNLIAHTPPRRGRLTRGRSPVRPFVRQVAGISSEEAVTV